MAIKKKKRSLSRKSDKALKTLLGFHVLIALRIKIPMAFQPTGNAVMGNITPGYLIDFDEEYLYVGRTSTQWDMLITRKDCVVVTVTPTNEELELISMKNSGEVN